MRRESDSRFVSLISYIRYICFEVAINRFFDDVTSETSNARVLIDFSISCEMTRNLIESTSHSIVVRLNFAHFAQRRDRLSTQHKELSTSQCRHLMMTSRSSIAIFSTIATCAIFSFEETNLQSSINVNVFDTHHLSS